MNKRIKQLALEADEYCRDYVPNWNMDDYNLKFAELIVRECAEQIKTQGISASSEGYGGYEIGFNAGLFHALYTTKQHFGVEE